MKFRLISGIVALQLACAMNASAQTYTFTVGSSDATLRIADHIGGEMLTTNWENTLESYNLDIEQLKLVGLIRFEGASGILLYATHYGLLNTSDHLKVLKGYSILNNKVQIVAERVTEEGEVKSAVLLQYDKDTGKLLAANELAKLPEGYKLTHVFDVAENFADNTPQRILCTVDYLGEPRIAELQHNGASYTFREFKDTKPPKSITSVHYVRSYHYGSVMLGKPSFYGLADNGKEQFAFCYYTDPSGSGGGIFEKYYLTSLAGKPGINGVQMNGSYGQNGANFRIEMAFTDLGGGVCIQQKDEMIYTNWQRYYQFPKKEQFRLGTGRDGHGTKMSPYPMENNSAGYFLGAWMPNIDPAQSLVTAINFDGSNGDVFMPRSYKMNGMSIFKDGSFPSTSYDPGVYWNNDYGNNYTFIADVIKPGNKFYFGTGNTLVNGDKDFFCSAPHKIDEFFEKRLKTEKAELYPNNVATYEVEYLEWKKYDVEVVVEQTCEAEHKLESLAQINSGSRLINNNESTITVDNGGIHIGAAEKSITAVRIFSIDGRSIAEVRGLNAKNYEHQFTKPMVAGIYVVQIVFNDNTTETRKISIR